MTFPASVLAFCVAFGAVDPGYAGSTAYTTDEGAGTVSIIDIEKGRQFWAFQKPKLPPIPVSRESKTSAPIDAFIAAAKHWSLVSTRSRPKRSRAGQMLLAAAAIRCFSRA